MPASQPLCHLSSAALGAEAAREIAFIDPAVADIPVLLRGLRPGVDAILLDRSRDGLVQVSEALAGRQNIAVAHIIAHGAPGQVQFGANTVTAEELGRRTAELARIGAALGQGGDIRLWSCETGAGEQGAAFVAAMAQATGVRVAASSMRVGAAAQGGRWELDVTAKGHTAGAPITPEAAQNYAGVLGTITLDPNPLTDGYLSAADAAGPFTISGTDSGTGVTASTKITLTFYKPDGVTVLLQKTNVQVGNPSGTLWSYTLTAAEIAQISPEGGSGYKLVVSDNAGSSSVARNYTVDTAAPAAPAIVEVMDDAGVVTGTVASGGTTDDATPTVKVSLAGTGALANDKVTLTVGTVTTSYTLTSADVTEGYALVTSNAISGGDSKTIRATITDAAGNTSAASTTTYSIILDTTPGVTQTGSDGADTLAAGDDGDMLVGFKGADYLVGGSGNDVFVFSPGDGPDFVNNFTPGTDKLLFAGGLTSDDVYSFQGSFDAGGTVLTGLYVQYGSDDSRVFLNGVSTLQPGDITFGSVPGGVEPLPSFTVVQGATTTQVGATAYTGPITGLQWQYTGSAAAEAVTGTGRNDHMAMGRGADTVRGGAGDDFL
ncbi:DUF4347 domain-containing protein, partial [Roseicella aerolata]